jgi:uncharacterized protein (TIGR03382 family)
MMTRTIVAAAALTSVVACMELPPGDWTSPYYWGEVFLDKYRHELVVDDLEPGPPPLEEPRTVLLITGVTIPAEWFDPMVARLERDGFRPVVYEPPELLSGSLFENSELLGEVIEQLVAESGEDKIDILAECTGGVIARHYIQSLGGDQYVSRLVTFISPQNGVKKAPWAASLVGWPALHDLSPGSEFLEAVNSAPLPEHVPITSIYTCTDEYIQPYETSIIPGATNIGLCDGFVGHFEFFWNPDIYLIMHGALTEPLPGDPADPADPADPSDPADDPTAPADAVDDPAMGGCQAGGDPSGAAALLVAAAALLWLRRRAPSRPNHS